MLEHIPVSKARLGVRVHGEPTPIRGEGNLDDFPTISQWAGKPVTSVLSTWRFHSGVFSLLSFSGGVVAINLLSHH